MTQKSKCTIEEKRLTAAQSMIKHVQSRLRKGTLRKRKLVWLELTGCSGNIISLLDGFNPDYEYLVTSMVDLVYNNSLMASEGEEAVTKLLKVLEKDFILAVEGAVSLRNNGLFNVIGRWQGRPLTALEVIKILGDRAASIIAVGDCASFGGVSAASPNPAQCVGVEAVIKKKVIKLTGCPCHPDWFTGTLAHILLYGEPALDSYSRPLLFYSTLIHDRCPRRGFFDRGIFAEKLGEETCMFKLGCRGPVTRTDCPIREWNGHVNWPIGGNTPCIGCAQFGFPDAMEPFISFETTEERSADE